MSGTMRPTAENWSCGFEPDPKNWVCAKEATWHGFKLTENKHAIESMMASCDDHMRRMSANADYVHSMRNSCGLPGSRFRWPENECYTDVDFGVLVKVSFAEAIQ